MSQTLQPIGSNHRSGQGLSVVIGAGGLGMAVARRMGDTARLLVADRDREHLETQIERLRAEGHDAEGMVCEITDEKSVLLLGDRARELGPVISLVHVLGLSPSLGDGPTVLAVNLRGCGLTAAVFREVLEQGAAAVFVSSLAAHGLEPSAEVAAVLDEPLSESLVEDVEAALGRPLDSSTAYGLSKWALNRMCRRLAAPWGHRLLRIISLSPGLIATPMGAIEFAARPEKMALYQQSPLRREGTMVEVADAVEFLTSSRASFITGTDLLIDGGLAAAQRFPAPPA